MDNLQPGDLVQLKSGGPTMTVDYIDNDVSAAYCVWFDESQARQRARFNLATLKKVESASAKSGVA